METGVAGVRSPMIRCKAPLSASGPVREGRFPFTIGVHDAPDNFLPIGMASSVGWTEDGLAVWMLTVHDADVPGRSVIVDREFRGSDSNGTRSHDLHRTVGCQEGRVRARFQGLGLSFWAAGDASFVRHSAAFSGRPQAS